MTRITGLCKMLSDPIRLRILQALTISDLCVCELSDSLQISQSTLSNHLATLRHTGIVRTRRDGVWIYYQLAPDIESKVRGVLAVFSDGQDEPKITDGDRGRINARLTMRVNGRCARSYGQLQKMENKQNETSCIA